MLYATLITMPLVIVPSRDFVAGEKTLSITLVQLQPRVTNSNQ